MRSKILKTARYRNYLKSSSFQMALFFTILCGGAILTLGYFNYHFNKGHFIEGTEQLIDSEIRNAELLNDNDRIIEMFQETTKTEERIFLLTDPNKNKIAGNINIFPEEVSLLTEGIVTVIEWNKKYAAKIYTFSDGRLLLVGVDITKISNNYNFMSLLSVLSIIFMFVVIATSYLISHFVVKRTNNIAATAQSIMKTGDLSKRIDVDSRWDDLSNMAETLNSLLARIDDLMVGIRRVSDNIAHDLRTPLTRLRNDLEELKTGSSVSHDEVIAEADHLLNTFNALLRISRIETERQKSQFQQIALHDVAHDAIELYEALAEDKSIKIHSNLEEINYTADQNLFFQAIANLLDNAIKFTPENGEIFVTLHKQEKEAVILTIQDTGAGVPDDQTRKIFDRFYRADTSRNKSGNGLGLSLVAAVIDLHDGTIAVENTNPGLKFTITFKGIKS